MGIDFRRLDGNLKRFHNSTVNALSTIRELQTRIESEADYSNEVVVALDQQRLIIMQARENVDKIIKEFKMRFRGEM